MLTPNLACVWRRAADEAVLRLARDLNWPRVRLLLIGHAEPPPPPPVAEADAAGVEGVPEAADAADAASELGGGDGGGGAAQGCWLATLDRELLWLIADWLVSLDCAEGS